MKHISLLVLIGSFVSVYGAHQEITLNEKEQRATYNMVCDIQSIKYTDKEEILNKCATTCNLNKIRFYEVGIPLDPWETLAAIELCISEIKERVEYIYQPRKEITQELKDSMKPYAERLCILLAAEKAYEQKALQEKRKARL